MFTGSLCSCFNIIFNFTIVKLRSLPISGLLACLCPAYAFRMHEGCPVCQNTFYDGFVSSNILHVYLYLYMWSKKLLLILSSLSRQNFTFVHRCYSLSHSGHRFGHRCHFTKSIFSARITLLLIHSFKSSDSSRFFSHMLGSSWIVTFLCGGL